MEDEMKLNLWSKLTMKIISKIIEKKVKTLLGDSIMSEDELKTYLLKII